MTGGNMGREEGGCRDAPAEPWALWIDEASVKLRMQLRQSWAGLRQRSLGTIFPRPAVKYDLNPAPPRAVPKSVQGANLELARQTH